MLGKVIKYELRSLRTIILILNLAVLIFSGFFAFRAYDFSRTLHTTPLSEQLFGTMVALYVMLLITAYFASYILPAIRFYRSMYGDEGYLTHTLPVKLTTLLTGKTIVFFLVQLLNMIVTSLGILIVLAPNIPLSEIFETESFHLFTQEVSRVLHAPFSVLVLMGIISFLVSLVSGIGMIYVCIALGCQFNRHRGIACFGIYLGYSMLLSVVGNLLITIFVLRFAAVLEPLSTIEELEKAVPPIFYSGYFLYLIFFAVIGGLSFWLTHFLTRKKLKL